MYAISNLDDDAVRLIDHDLTVHWIDADICVVVVDDGHVNSKEVVLIDKDEGAISTQAYHVKADFEEHCSGCPGSRAASPGHPQDTIGSIGSIERNATGKVGVLRAGISEDSLVPLHEELQGRNILEIIACQYLDTNLLIKADRSATIG